MSQQDAIKEMLDQFEELEKKEHALTKEFEDFRTTIFHMYCADEGSAPTASILVPYAQGSHWHVATDAKLLKQVRFQSRLRGKRTQHVQSKRRIK